jgi:ribosome maturation factor RimP
VVWVGEDDWAAGPFFVSGALACCVVRAEVKKSRPLAQVALEPGRCRNDNMKRADPKLAQLVRSVVEPMGYECVGVEHDVGGGSGAVLRVYIDHADGIGLGDCEAVSHQLSGALDVDDPIAGQYDLEVSSPGLDRPLFELEHFRRFEGARARIRLVEKLDGRRRFDGRLAGTEGDAVLLSVDGTRVALPFDRIESARLVPEF